MKHVKLIVIIGILAALLGCGQGNEVAAAPTAAPTLEATAEPTSTQVAEVQVVVAAPEAVGGIDAISSRLFRYYCIWDEDTG